MPDNQSVKSFRQGLTMLALLSGNRYYCKNEIMERLEFSERTFHRYITTLREYGFVIDFDSGYYKMEKHTGHCKQISDLLHFSEEEAYILNEAIHAIEASTKTRENLIAKLSALYDSDRIAIQFVGKEKSSKIKPLLDAIHQKKQVELLGYQSSGSGRISDRVVEPFLFTHNYISIWGFEPASQRNKLFKVSRMQKVRLCSEDWQYSNEHKASFLDCFRIGGEKKIPVKFDMTLKAKNLLVEEYPLSAQFISAINDNLYCFDGWVSTLDGIGRFMLGLPGEFFRLQNPDLKAFIKKKQLLYKNF